MTKTGWVWYVILGMFYLSLSVITFTYFQEATHIRDMYSQSEIVGEFAGSDWVSWKNTEKGVVAERVHPLPEYKALDKSPIQPGDRLLSLNGTPILKKEVADKITSVLNPEKNLFTVVLERPNPFTLSREEITTFIFNGFRLSFGFNEIAIYWHLIGWIVGMGAFVALIMLAILLPIMRGNWKQYIPLLGIVSSALVFFFLQLIRHLYLIVENNLQNIGFEKVFLISYVALLLIYAACYFYFKSNSRNILVLIPSIAVGIFLCVNLYQVIFIEKRAVLYQDLIERYAILYFLLHIAGGLFLFISGSWESRSLRSFLGLLGIALLAGLGIWYYTHPHPVSWIHREHILFGYSLLLFFPLVNATFLQLQFGKVSLVITKSIQYLVAFVFSLVIYLLITQLFEYLRPGIQSRQILEFVTFVLLMMILRLAYLANENKFNKYFVSSQQQQLQKFKTFIASIPRYTSVANLRYDLVEQLTDFFNAENVHLWWKETLPENEAENDFYQRQENIYITLTDHHTVWSKTKEISPFRLDSELEKQMQKSAYTLICPITMDAENYALLQLGKKRRGVYNLSDLELISQLIQQTQLTLNVLHLVNREKELIQQTYEANLTALRSQINPHFLFNTLNSIGEMVHESAELAEQAVEKLAYIFRYTLDKSSQNFVSLGNEMSLISTYLELEKFRFGDRLNVHINMEPSVKEVQIPAFILSTLVENCIKHGISKILGKGLVSVEAFKEEGYLVCEVIDNGPGIDLTRIHKSHGLSNSIARLENIYDLKNLLYFENTGEGTYVRMKIPLADQPQMAQ
ncbi:MAG: histidine kinase [Bacteroidota bacterium]